MEFCEDSELAYPASRHRFEPGEGFALGADYRLAHLPLVAPGHRDAIASVPGKDYCDGHYATPRTALVVQIPAEALDADPVHRTIEKRARAASFGAKIAWDVGRHRRDVLHATLAGPLDEAGVAACERAARDFVDRHGPLRVRLGGPFAGNRNHGRFYLPLYPPKIDGRDAFAALLAAAGRSYGGFYGVGLWHLADGLDATETAELAALLDDYRDRAPLETPARLALLTVDNDLALGAVTWRWIAPGNRA